MYQDLTKRFEDEKARQYIQGLRTGFSRRLFDEVRPRGLLTLVEAVSVVKGVLECLSEVDFSFQKMEPGHGKGHLIRDYVNALLLFSHLKADQKQVFIGFIAGVLHDIGCAVVQRYEERSRVIRHAEAAAILLHYVFEEVGEKLGLNREEKFLIEYCVAAHTHYTRDFEVETSTGEKVVIQPYVDTDDQGPIWAVWFTRWVDRLDCNGPSYFVRHFLSLSFENEHYEYAQSGFFQVDFDAHMVIDPADPTTFVGHMKMFADSQTNDSVYGRNDFGRMVKLRDEYREMMYSVITAIQDVSKLERPIFKNIKHHLEKLEPMIRCTTVADGLIERLRGLPTETRDGWVNGFLVMMQVYHLWFHTYVVPLLINLPDFFKSLPGISEDICGDLRGDLRGDLNY
ncbi:hypothetical protein A2533_03385 [Candidatus Falkowbacteria bacterium RIFOXYD2_FULL_35_9]|uniref:HD domain-containing protein n=1 Tax=Candidatus Falkowbacteria bacterium RIFOXYC2_FULL_36_12 TaxID=1798002 RepID=A0A1F5SWN7_9BACT|nr:MAG: hypothetical protein A2478_00565 [Candidatus Falkowbacteria bacterium RIFOXYC2_FULL_36_12]OGF32997.1 MAG: hypothetical protein A2223_02065 [Candidatus Falkowbacteria bacterium RIFOXYA2_FULL_35_8]OGF47044.1 MAG: hypothetical protein A2533_03385 [Candidatus Falkowbacteria bacterium RIFOXYD2_FULL_35_9]